MKILKNDPKIGPFRALIKESAFGYEGSGALSVPYSQFWYEKHVGIVGIAISCLLFEIELAKGAKRPILTPSKSQCHI